MRTAARLLAATAIALLAACGGGSSPAAQNPVDPARSTFTVGPAAVADGLATESVVVTARDAGGAPLSGLVAVFQVTGANLSPSVATTGADGTATALLTATVAGAKDVSVVIGGTAVTSHATATFLAGIPTALAFTTSPASGIAGALGPVALALTDAHGIGCPATLVNVVLSGGPAGATLGGTVTATTNATGGAAFSDLAVNRAGTGYTLHANNAATPGPTATSAAFDRQAGPAHLSGSTLSATPTSIAADGVETSTLQATIGDQYGNPVAGATVSLSSNVTATITQPAGVTGADGKVSGSVKSLLAGTSTISAAVNAATVAQAQLAVTALPPSATLSTVVVAQSPVPADGTSTSTVTVTVKDRLSRTISGSAVSLSASPAVTITPPSTTSSAGGVAQFLVKSASVVTTTLTATAGGVTLSAAPTVDFVTPTFTVGGTLTGLLRDGLLLATAGQSDLAIPANATSFAFATAKPVGTGYSVSVKTQPSGQRCTVTSGAGTVGGNVTSIRVACLLTWKQVAGGDGHSLGLTTDGRLYAWGDNSYGQLGDGTTTQRTRPTYVGSSYAFVAAGANHTLAIDTVGNLFAWGNNSDGQLGDKSSTQRLTPTWITAGVKAVAAGGAHSILVFTDGTLWACGYNLRGQIGQGVSTVGSNTLLKVGGIGSVETFAAVTAGYDFSVAITTGGVPYAFGDNSNGQLGNNTTTWPYSGAPLMVGGGFVLTSAAAGFHHVIGITTGGTLVGWGYNVDGEVGASVSGASAQVPVAVAWAPATPAVTAVAAGRYFSMANKTVTDGVACWGDNGSGQYGDMSVWPRTSPGVSSGQAKAIAAGKYHSLFIDANDYLTTAGYNATGQLGDGSTAMRTLRTVVLEPLQ
jgi:alpha-tubulin suppressor-like RCC1 family protein